MSASGKNFMKNYRINLLIFSLSLFLYLILAESVFALEPGTLLYRTSSNGKMYGYSSDELLVEKNGIIKHIYPGHVAIYIGQENGEHYVVEALSTGVVKTPARYFINESLGEELVAVKLPKNTSPWQRAKVVALAKNLVAADLAYDFDFSHQKGPGSGDWTCVGLVEKLYESANIDNPSRLDKLEYNSDNYAIDITPDGFDNVSVYNDEGDVFSEMREFSKINRRDSTILPLPEIIGYNAGREYHANRYIFLPYTQALQNSLEDQELDIELSSYFADTEVRGKVNNVAIILKWSLINNPLSSLKQIAQGVKSVFNNNSSSSAELLVANTTKSSLEPKVVVDNKQKLVSDNLVVVEKPKAIENDTKDNSQVELAQANTNETPINEDIFSKLAIAEESASKSNDLKGEDEAVSLDANIKDVNKTSNSYIEITEKSNKQESAASALWTPLLQTLSSSTVATTTTTTPSQNSSTPVIITNNNQAEENEESEEKIKPLTLVISRLYAEGVNDWLEIWNYGEEDINLADREIRLEKAKTALDPGIILRFNSETDALFPGGRVIAANSSYRIVRDDAQADLKSAAHAIALRPDFTFTNDAYSIYLAKGPVSSPEDEDIIDLLAYGEATYFEGQAPAAALDEKHLLRRKAQAATTLEDTLNDGSQANWPPVYDSDNNVFDFLLWPLGGEIEEEEEQQQQEEEQEQENEEEEEEDEQEEVDEEDAPFTLQTGIDSPSLFSLWSFSECRATSSLEMINKNNNLLVNANAWQIGRFGCGLRLPYYNETPLDINLEPKLNGENFSLFFNFKIVEDFGHFYFSLHNQEEGAYLKTDIYPDRLDFEGFPGLSGSYQYSLDGNREWHQGVLVWAAADNYWAFYIDGQELFFQNFSGLAPGFDLLRLASVAGPIIIDDLALWQRSLSGADILDIFQAQAPFNPQFPLLTPPNLSLKHFWQFDEAEGLIANDEISALNLELTAEMRDYNGLSGKAIKAPVTHDPFIFSLPDLQKNNFSLSFWYQNNNDLMGASGRFHLSFFSGEQFLAEFTSDTWRQRLNTGEFDYILAEGENILAHDNLWHHIALVYDDYRYRWQFFVDGVLKLEEYRLPVPTEGLVDRLTWRSTVFGYRFDNFKIWQGILSPEKVLLEYESEKNE